MVSLRLSELWLRLASPWHVLGNDGSFRGWFDWVPRHLRVGPWSPLAKLVVLLYAVLLPIYKPALRFEPLGPAAYDGWWWLHVAVAVWGCVVFVHIWRKYGAGICYTTYTMWSWQLLIVRCGLVGAGAAARSDTLLWAADALRFPVLAGASITFGVSAG